MTLARTFGNILHHRHLSAALGRENIWKLESFCVYDLQWRTKESLKLTLVRNNYVDTNIFRRVDKKSSMLHLSTIFSFFFFQTFWCFCIARALNLLLSTAVRTTSHLLNFLSLFLIPVNVETWHRSSLSTSKNLRLNKSTESNSATLWLLQALRRPSTTGKKHSPKEFFHREFQILLPLIPANNSP